MGYATRFHFILTTALSPAYPVERGPKITKPWSLLPGARGQGRSEDYLHPRAPPLQTKADLASRSPVCHTARVSGKPGEPRLLGV